MNTSLPLCRPQLFRYWRNLFFLALVLFFTNAAHATCNLTAAWTFSIHGDTVLFSAQDTNSATHHFWNFGDGSAVVSGSSALHIYPNYGTYHVCFYDYIPNTSCSDSLCQNVTLSGTYPCTLTAAWTYSNRSGDTVHFYAVDTASSVGHYWTFGDGTGGSGISPSHTYTTSGTYHVCLHVYHNNCVDSSCSTISVGAPCVTNAAWTSYTHGDTVFFSAADTNTTVHLDWNMGDGTYVFGPHPSHVYANGGTYHVCLFAYIPNASCLDSFCNNVTIGTGCHITATWSYTTHGDTVYFVGTDTNTTAHHYWSFGDGTGGSGTTISHVYATAGTHHVCLYVYIPNTNCTDSSCNNVVITSTCTANAAWQSYTVRDSVHFYAATNDSTVHLVWTFGDGTYGSGRTPWHGYTTPGTYHVCLYAYIPNTNCRDSFCSTVTIGSGCTITSAWTYTTSGDTVRFTGAGTNTTAVYYWRFGDGGIGQGISPTHVYATPGTYHVCQYVYIPNTTCSDSTCNTIVVTSGCHLSAAWQSYAHGDTVRFYSADTSSVAHHIWNYGDGTYGSGVYSTHTYTAAGTYHVCLFVYIPNTNCTDSFCNTVTVGSGCNISAAWSYTTHGDTAYFTAADTNTAAHHYWNFGDGNGGSGITVTHVYLQSGTYHVCLYAYIMNTTCTDSSCNNITIANTSCLTNAAWTSYTRGDTAHFYAYDTSTLVHLIWNFGDGNTGSGKTPTHTYAQAGTYHVCLYAYIPNTNCSDSFCNTVTIAAGCNITAAWSYMTYGDSVRFTSAGTNTTAHYYWNFGDGSTGSGVSPSHVYAGPGIYHVCSYVYIPNTTCYDSSCNTVVIDSACSTNAVWQSYTRGDSVHFYAANNNTNVYLSWHFGDGTYGSGISPIHVYTQPGTYRVCLYAYIPNSRCIDSFCNTVTIGSGCNITATWSYTVQGDSAYFVAVDTNTTAHHIWNFGDGTYGSGTTSTHVYSAAGSYHVCLFVYIPNTNCVDSSCNNVAIVDSCITNAAWHSYTHGDTVYFYASDTNSTVHYDWNTGDGTYVFGTHPIHVYAGPGTYHICLYAYKPGTPCIDSFCNTVTIGTGCTITSAWSYTAHGDSVHFNGLDSNTAAHHYWSFGDGSGGSGFGISHVYTAPGTYHVCHYVYLPNTNCFDSTCNTITIAGPCNLTAAWNFIHSGGDTFHFYALIPDSNTYMVWIFGDGTSSSGSYVIHSYPQPGTYHVCVRAYISGTPCTDSMCIDVTVGNSCAVTAAWASLTRINDSIQFYALDPDTNAHHIWTFGDGASASGSYAAHTFPTGGTYHVCLYVYIPNTTCSDSLCKDVSTVLGIGELSTYPTINLSPNPFNQYAIMNIDGPASVYDVQIYDMIGQLVRTERATNNSIMIARGNLTSGMYLYTVLANGVMIGKGKMTVE